MFRLHCLPVAVLSLCAGACAASPALRSPLRDRLEGAETPVIEEATRDCLNSHGWAADPIGSYSGGANVVTARNKEKVQTQVYIYPRDQKPRLTGGPEDDKFWACLSSRLGGGPPEQGAGSPASSAGTPESPEAPAGSGAPEGPAKGAPQDPGDKGGGPS